jgi:signal transduction histidine kinase
MGALAKVGLAPETKDESAAALQEAQKLEAIGRLVSGVAHDFNNLLTGIVLCSDLLLAGLEKESRLRRYAQEIRTAGSQGASLIRQLMEVAAPHVIEAHLLSINDVILGMRNLLDRLIGENIQLITEFADDLELVNADSAQIQQIVLNLVLNARDAMPNGGQIVICTRNKSVRMAEEHFSTVELEIRDTGCGMHATTRARVFEPFFTTKEPGKGTGLGLSTVLSIAQKLKGTVEIESDPGQGTTLTVRLPAAPAELPRKKKFGPDGDCERSMQTRR